jgi:hypothetical protein
VEQTRVGDSVGGGKFFSDPNPQLKAEILICLPILTGFQISQQNYFN